MELATEGQSIPIVAVNSRDHKAKVRAAQAKVNSKHSMAFQKLAEQLPVRFLTFDDILESHQNQIDIYGGSIAKTIG